MLAAGGNLREDVPTKSVNIKRPTQQIGSVFIKYAYIYLCRKSDVKYGEIVSNRIY